MAEAVRSKQECARPNDHTRRHSRRLIVGVLPPSFEFAPAGPAEFWATLHGYCADIPRACHPYVGVARLKEGVSVSTALADVSAIASQIAANYPQFNRDRSATVLPLADAILGDIRPTLIALLAGAGLLSLIGFVNVSSLLLVRAESRRREFAVRGALGAGRVRLLLQFVVEGSLLAGCGGLIGMALAFVAIRVLPGQIPSALLDNMPYLQALRFNPHSLLFARDPFHLRWHSLRRWSSFAAPPRRYAGRASGGWPDSGRQGLAQTWRRPGRGRIGDHGGTAGQRWPAGEEFLSLTAYRSSAYLPTIWPSCMS